MEEKSIGSSGRNYYLTVKDDGIYLKIVHEPLLFPVVPEDIFADLRKRKIPFEENKIEKIYAAADGTEHKISPLLDGCNLDPLLKIKVSPDKNKAYLQVYPALNKRQFNAEDIRNIMAEHGIVEGIKTEIFPKIVAEQDNFHEWLIAEGIECKNGEDAKLIFHFNPKGLDIKPRELEDGSVDFYNLNLIQLVQAGTTLVEKIPATQGVDGKNIYGENIKAAAGKDIRLPLGLNTQAINNNTALIATAQGHVVMANNKINVFPIYEVRGDVDFATGNIKFPGNVKVYGSVKHGFQIESGGDVEIAGNLEGEIIADGNVQVKKGIVRGKVTAKGYVYARSIEHGYIESGADVIVTEAIMHSTVLATRKISVGGKKGLIVGGQCSAVEEILAKNIGSHMATVTTLEVGVRPELRQEYKEISRKLTVNQENYDKVQKAIKMLQEVKQKIGELPPDKNSLLLKLNKTQYQITQENEELGKRKAELEGIFQDMVNAKVRVENAVYPGVTVIIGKATYTVRDEMRKVILKLDDLDVKPYPITG